jgi:hypothetical protein
MIKTVNHILILMCIVSFFCCERNDVSGSVTVAPGSSNYSGPHFEAVGDSGKIYYSYNGINWTEAVSPTTNALYGIVYGNGKFAAVGTAGAVVTSTDGINWNGTTISGSIPFYCLAYGNGTYVAAGQWMSMHIQVRTSTDLVTWSDHSISNPPGYTMNGITFGNGRFYMLGNNYSGWYSDDLGASWTVSDQIGSNYWGVVYANGKFTAVGAGGMIRESASADAGTWNNVNSGTCPGQVLAITYGNGKYVITGSSGDSAWSADGTSWTRINTGTSDNLNAVTYGGGLYVAVGDLGAVVCSVDGLTWTYVNISSVNLRGIAYK